MATVDTLVRRVQVAHLPPIDSGHGIARLPAKLMKDMGALGSIARAVLGGRATTADLRIQANFRLGQLRGLVRIASMSSSRRRRLMGLARPRHGRKDRAA